MLKIKATIMGVQKDSFLDKKTNEKIDFFKISFRQEKNMPMIVKANKTAYDIHSLNIDKVVDIELAIGKDGVVKCIG